MTGWKQFAEVDLTDDQNNTIKVIHNGIMTEDVASVTVVKGTNNILGFGRDVKLSPEVESETLYPVVMGGVITCFELFSALMKHLVSKSMEGTKLWRLRLSSVEVKVKGPLSELEHRALVDAIEYAGARKVFVTSVNGFISCSES